MSISSKDIFSFCLLKEAADLRTVCSSLFVKVGSTLTVLSVPPLEALCHARTKSAWLTSSPEAASFLRVASLL